MRSAAARTRRDERREALFSKVDTARAAHRRHFKLRHHAIAAMPIPGREKHKLYKMLSFEKKAAERRLRATIKGWRTLGVDTHPGSWKEFLAARAGHGDQRAIRRLARKSGGLVIKSGEKQVRALPSRSGRTSRGSIVHNLPNGVRLRESGRIDRAPRRGPRRCARAAGERRQAEVRNEGSHAPGIEARTSATGETGCRTRVGNCRRAPALRTEHGVSHRLRPLKSP